MLDDDPGLVEYRENTDIFRVTIIPEIYCRGRQYLLVIKKPNHVEWEIPGGTIEAGTVLSEAEREWSEEVGLSSNSIVFTEIYTGNMNMSSQNELIYTNAKTKSGSTVKPKLVRATIYTDKLPEITLSPEHSDYMFVEIPNNENGFSRREYQILKRQFSSQKLVLAKKHEGKVYKLRLTDDISEIEGRPKNISQISGLALAAYVQVSFDKQL